MKKSVTTDMHNLKAYLLLILTTLCWGANALFGRLAVGEVSPMLLVSLRWFTVVLLLILFASRPIRKEWSDLRNHLPFLAVMGTMGFTAFNALFYLAAHSTYAINLGIVQGAIPVFVMIGAYFAYNTRVGSLQLLGVVVTIFGAIIVASSGDLQQLLALNFNHGDLLMIIACTLYAGYAVGLKRCPAVSPLALFTVFSLAALIASIPLTLIEYSMGNMLWPSITGWLVVALIAIFPSFVAQIGFMHGVRIIGPGRAGVFINLIPVFASLMAVTFLGESFQGYHAAALVLVLSGIWLAEHKQS